MTETLRTDVKLIHEMLGYAQKKCGALVSSLYNPEAKHDQIFKQLDSLCALIENTAITMRNACEQSIPNELSAVSKKTLPDMSVAGSVSVSNLGWIHIELNTLLPHCRFQTPAYLTDTIIRLLDDYEKRCALPRFDEAILIIDEHCNTASRTVYDQDNKGYKAVPNAIKGRVVRDDDQFMLELALLSTYSDNTACHIYILPKTEAGDFFLYRNDGLLP